MCKLHRAWNMQPAPGAFRAILSDNFSYFQGFAPAFFRVSSLAVLTWLDSTWIYEYT